MAKRLAIVTSACAAVGGFAWWLAGAAPAAQCCAPDRLGPTAALGSDVAARRATPPSVRSGPPRAGTWLHPTIKVVGPDDEEAVHYAPVAFAELASFPYETPGLSGEGTAEERPRAKPAPREIPRRILALSGARVAINGFMMPMDFDGGGVSEFLLNGNYDMCAFGAPSGLNEWVLARLTGGRRTRFVGHAPITVYGTLDVGERERNGRVESLYRMEVDFIGVGVELFRR
jgi:hypothetical protein